MIEFRQKGDFKRLTKYLERAKESVHMGMLDKYAKEGVAALKDDINNLNDFLIIADAGGQMLTYHNSPIKHRTDFAKPSVSASWVVMTPRRYEVNGKLPDFEETRMG